MKVRKIIGISSPKFALLGVAGLAFIGACRMGTLIAADSAAKKDKPVLRGQGPNGDWTTDAPGVRRLITPADMPLPYATPSTDNQPHVVPRREGMWPKAPDGFK